MNRTARTWYDVAMNIKEKLAGFASKVIGLLESRKFWMSVAVGVTYWLETGNVKQGVIIFLGSATAGLIAEDVGKGALQK